MSAFVSLSLVLCGIYCTCAQILFGIRLRLSFFALHQDPCSTSCSSAAAAASPPHLRCATADLDLKKAPQPTSFFSSP